MDIFRVVVSPCSAHPVWLFVVGHHIALIGEFFKTDRADLSLLNNFPMEQLSHFGGRAKFSIPTRMVGIFDSLHSHSDQPWFGTDFKKRICGSGTLRSDGAS